MSTVFTAYKLGLSGVNYCAGGQKLGVIAIMVMAATAVCGVIFIKNDR